MTEFISRKYGNDGYEVIIKTDSHEHYRETEDFARRLIDHAKPMTNGDRIRMMSDDEFIELFGYNHFCNKIPIHNCKAGDMTCCECALEWLKEPVEE